MTSIEFEQLQEQQWLRDNESQHSPKQLPRRPPGFDKCVQEDILNKLHRLSGFSRQEDWELAADQMGVERSVFDLGIDYMIKTQILNSDGPGKIKRPIPGKKRDGHGFRTSSSRKLMITYFPEVANEQQERADWTGWLNRNAGYARAGTETAPTTSLLHYHIFATFTEAEYAQWIVNLWPTAHIEHARKEEASIRYCIKGGNDWGTRGNGMDEPSKKTTQRIKTGGVGTGQEKWTELLRLIEEGNIDEIKNRYPRDWIIHHAMISKLAAEKKLERLLKEMDGQPEPDLKAKNVFIWGDAGTGKTHLARARSGERPYLKLQCKWWDGISDQATGIIWNDVVPLQGFNWQSLLDSADQYPFLCETKGGTEVVSARNIPVTVTSNHSIEELMHFTTKARQEAFHRRFNIIKVTWFTFSGFRGLK
jgi:hypothetical protein